MTEEELDRLRRPAFAIAYRTLDTVSEAEDVVHEGILPLHRAPRGGERIEPPRAYLSTVLSRLSLDELRSARVRCETYMGKRLPEPHLARAPARKPRSRTRQRDRADARARALQASERPRPGPALLSGAPVSAQAGGPSPRGKPLGARERSTAELSAPGASQEPGCCKHQRSSHPASGRASGIGHRRQRKSWPRCPRDN